MDLVKELHVAKRNLTVQQKTIQNEHAFVEDIKRSLIRNIKPGHTDSTYLTTLDVPLIKSLQKRLRKLLKKDKVRHKLQRNLVEKMYSGEYINSMKKWARQDVNGIRNEFKTQDKQLRFFLAEHAVLQDILEYREVQDFDGKVSTFIRLLEDSILSRIKRYKQLLERAYDFYENRPFTLNCTISPRSFSLRKKTFNTNVATIPDTSYLIDAAEYAQEKGAEQFDIRHEGQLILIPHVQSETRHHLNYKNMPSTILRLVESKGVKIGNPRPTADEIDTLTEMWEKVVHDKSRSDFRDTCKADINILTTALRRSRKNQFTLILSSDKDITKVAQFMGRKNMPVRVRTWTQSLKKVA